MIQDTIMKGKNAKQSPIPNLAPETLYDWLTALGECDHQGFALCDAAERISFCNATLAALVGLDRFAAEGKYIRDLPFRFVGDEPSSLWNAIRSKVSWTGRLPVQNPDGRQTKVEFCLRPMSRGGFLLVTRDISREEELEHQIWQAQKMEAIGRLAGGVAHDFNNILTSIIGFAQLIHEQLPPDHPCTRDIEEILRAGERATRLTQQLLTFSRKRIVASHALDPKALIMGLDKLLRQTIGEDVELVVLLDPATPIIMADEGLLEQAILNLAINARDAMPQGGTLTIHTRGVRLEPKFCSKHSKMLPGDYALISVRDTGIGMDSSIREHLFEPFFTTKEKGKGTGLGLSIVYGVIRHFDGFVEVDTAPGKGTEFRLYFPAATRQERTKHFVNREPVRGGNETILIVEDENSVRSLMLRVLRAYGYRVLEARNGEEGLCVFRQSAPPPDLVLSDIVMPHMGGPKMVEEIRKIAAQVKVLYMSGFGGEFTSNRESDLGAPFLMKPFTAETLARRVRETLDAGCPDRCEKKRMGDS